MTALPASSADILLPIEIDAYAGTMLVRLPAPEPDGTMLSVIHQTVARTGLGFGGGIEGIDRGQFGPSRLLVFRRQGNRVFAEYRNPLLRSTSSAQAASATADSHYVSVVWSGTIASTEPDGSALIDISGLLKLDGFGVLTRLNKGQQRFTQAAELTFVDVHTARAYSGSLEVDVTTTFRSDNPGPDIVNASGGSSDPRAVTLTIHHSLIRLPEGYAPRRFDPRINEMWDLPMVDFSAAPGESTVQRLVRRFRLEKTDPGAARSRVKKPIVFHVDRAAPEPIRSALLEGAAWWADAFEAAGFIDAYRVEILPEGADPMESCYNLILWNDLQTPGWAFGQSALDPRTGEVMRAIVYLCSQRFRLNILLLEAVLGAERTGTGGPGDPVTIAMERVRQLSAHETGHSLGFQHNFIGSAEGWTTVMDYPTPTFRIAEDGTLDGAGAYPTGIGEWDKFAVSVLYGDDAGMEQRIREGVARLGFGTDADGRIDATGMAYNAPWDRGEDPIAEMRHVMRVRRIALDTFGLRNLRAGAPVHELRRRIAVLYLYHRFQINAAAKLVGGAHYGYPVNGGGGEHGFAPVSVAQQRDALDALLAALNPAELTFSDDQLRLLGAQHSGLPEPLEEMYLFRSRLGRMFDAGMAAECAAELTLTALLAPERMNRLAAAPLHGEDVLGLDEMLSRLIDQVFGTAPKSYAEAEAARRAQLRLVLMLARIVNGLSITTQPGAIRPRIDPPLSSTALAAVTRHLSELGKRLAASISADPAQRDHDGWLAGLIASPAQLNALLQSGRYDIRIPPGEPI